VAYLRLQFPSARARDRVSEIFENALLQHLAAMLRKLFSKNAYRSDVSRWSARSQLARNSVSRFALAVRSLICEFSGKRREIRVKYTWQELCVKWSGATSYDSNVSIAREIIRMTSRSVSTPFSHYASRSHSRSRSRRHVDSTVDWSRTRT